MIEKENYISTLSDDKHEAFRKEVQEFARKEVLPKAAELDRNDEFPVDILKKMGERGWLGIPFPKEYGGAGLDNLSYAIAVEEISRVCGSTGITLAAHTSLGVYPIYRSGTEEQKKRYMVPLARGEQIGSFGLTEPEAGSDAAGTKTTAKLEGEHFVINGSKRFITNISYAGTVVFTASQDPSKGVHGISAFIVQKGTPGFTPGKKEDKMGLRASNTAEIYFDECRIPKENLLGKEYEGFKIFMDTLDGGRISIGALALGEAQGALDDAISFAKQAEIKKSQWVQRQIADMYTEVCAARHMIYHAARLKDQGMLISLEGAMAKLFASEVCMRVTTQAIQLLGPEGLTQKHTPERFFRDAKLNEIGEGTSEIQKLVIARQVLGR